MTLEEERLVRSQRLGKYGIAPVGGGAETLSSLDDVDVSSLGARHALFYDGASLWQNRLIADADLPGAVARLVDVASALASHTAAADPHPDYLTQAEGDGLYHPLTTDLATQAELDAHTHNGLAPAGGTPGQVLKKVSGTNYDYAWDDDEVGSGGHPDLATHDAMGLATDAELSTAISNHEAAANPHPTYLTQAEGDGLYHPLTTDMATQAELNTHKSSSDHDGRYYTETEVDNALAGKADTGHNHDAAYVNEADHTKAAHDALGIDAATLDGIDSTGFATAGHSHSGLAPAGGTTGQVLKKSSNTNYDYAWAADETAAGGGPVESAVVLDADHANSTTTAGAVTGLAATLDAGTWLAKYWIVYRTAATTTGIQMYLDHTGTVTRLAGTWYQLTTGGAAATGIGDQATTATAQMLEGKGQRADNVASGTTQGVDTQNADQFAVFEALIVVTVSGTLNLMMNSEVGASAATIMAGSTLMLTKVA